ncbi:MAG: hypothetical protein IPM42_20390 [Saprospiraceae bacterium]|nr:hypothetical protein [Saprospiraceae bacterium]
MPVITYSYLTETSKWRATIGKRILKLTVLTSENKKKCFIKECTELFTLGTCSYRGSLDFLF